MIKYYFDAELTTIKNAKGADPQVLGEVIQQVVARTGGKGAARALRDEARDKAHPAHRHFEWDNKKAADAHRLEQARELIRCIHIVDDTTQRKMPAFISVRIEGEVRYKAHAEVLDAPKITAAVTQAFLRDIESVYTRYRDFAEAAMMEPLIEVLRVKVAPKPRPQDDNEPPELRP